MLYEVITYCLHVTLDSGFHLPFFNENIAQFDQLMLDSSLADFSNGSFSMGAWVKTSGTGVGIFSKSGAGGAWGSGARSFVINGSGRAP